MALDFNTEPYFDDYDSLKDFYRILFRPSYAVQARELTQIQTILQNQVTRFGDHVFKNGSQVIPGSVNIDNSVHFIKLEQFTGTLDVTTYIHTFKNKVITGETSGVKMRVLDTSADTDRVVDSLDVPTLYCKIEGIADDNVTNRLIPGENIVAYAADNQIASNFRLTEDQLSDIPAVVKLTGNVGETATTYTNNPSSDVLGFAYSVDVQAGIYYIDGIFVRNSDLKLYVGRFTNTPSYRVGFKVTESTVTPEDDTSILDNATGSYNFAAPGAHRYKIELSLVKLNLVATDNIRFVELVRVVDGRVQNKVEASSYAELEKKFARRTYDESGNYEVNKFKLSVREHLDNGSNFGVYKPLEGTAVAGVTYGDVDKFVMVVDPGKAYIQGYEVESSVSQFLEFNKAREINGVENNHVQRISEQTIGLNIGEYVKVQNLYKFPNLDNFEKVYLVNVLQNRPATLKANVSGGTVTSIDVVEGGEGYTGATQAVTLVATGSSGTGATATATITNGKITSVAVNTAGSGYSVAPEARALAGITLGAAPSSTAIVGTARVKSIQLYSGDYTAATSTNYKLGLFDIQMFTGKTFATDVKSIVGVNGSANFAANVTPTLQQILGSGTSSTSSTTLTGVGTSFISDVRVGDIVFLNDQKVGTVASIQSNLSLTLSANGLVAVSGGRLSVFSAALLEASYSTLLFPVGQKVVKTLRGVENGADTLKATTIIVRRLFSMMNTQTNKAQFEVTDTDETFLSDADLTNYLLINADTNIPVAITEDSITFDNNITRKIVSFNGVPNGNYYLIASVQQVVAAAQEKTKIVERNVAETITGKKTLTSSVIELAQPDILNLISVYMTPGSYDSYDANTAVDITNRYTLDNGQRDTYYTNGKLQLKPGFQVPSGAIRVTYDHFKVSQVTNGNYFSVDSYLTASGVSYDEIPSYYVTDPTTGKKVAISLTDVVDFRPILTTNNSFYPELPKIGSDMIAPIASYLGRIDKIVLDSVGKFNIISGVPSYDPKEPSDPKEGLILATVAIPPYTKDVGEVVIKQRDNRRYTMNDIGKLERRISNLEYYVSLSLLEKDTATMQIRDVTTGLDKYKNGFIVDQFTGHGIGDVKNDDYRIAVDTQNRVLRPMHHTVDLEIVEELSSGTDRLNRSYQKTGDIITLPYDETSYIFNNNATRAMDITAISMGAFKGQVTLYPEGDNWKSVNRRPDLVAIDDNNYDAIKFMAEQLGVTGTKWNEWQTNWTSVVVRPPVRSESRSGNTVTGYETTYTDYTGYNWHTGINTSLTSTVNAQDYGDRVVDMSYIPYMRARPVAFVAQNLKANTRFWSFFDETPIDDYVIPADKFVVTTVGQALMSFDNEDLNGNILADTPRRAYKGKIEPAFSVGDAIVNSTHNVTTISSITVPSFPAASFSLMVADTNGIKPGHHVVLYNLNHHTAYDQKNLDDLQENQIIPASVGISNTAAMAKELNLRKFKVLAVSGQSVTLANLDGSDITYFSSYSTASYTDGQKGKLYRLKASGVVTYGGVISAKTTAGTPATQEIHVTNIKNGFAVSETVTGTVVIGNTSSFNGVTINSINGSTVTTTPPTMMERGDKLIADAEGSVVGVFYIPEDETLSFRTGERTLKLTDNLTNSNAAFDSSGSSVYYSQGISIDKERTIVSTRTAKFVQTGVYEDTRLQAPVRRTTTSSRVIYQFTVNSDPLAQTFTVNSPGGVFVTSIDLYFSESGNRPISIELRNTDNGVPSSKVVPFSQVTKTVKEIKTSDDSSVATTFTFKSPIYLQDTETYCVVVMTDEPGAQLYVSEMGQTDILTGNTIAGQPLTGSLYASQNAKEWEIHPLLDMKFVLRKAKFNTSVSPEVKFRTNPPQPLTLDLNPFEVTPGTNKIRVFAPNHGFMAGETVVISNVAAGLYGANSATYGIPDTLLNRAHTVASVGLDKDSFVIDLVVLDALNNNMLKGTNANFIKGEYGGSGVMCSRSIPLDVMYFKSSDLSFQDTKIEYYVSAQKESGLFTGYMPFVPNSNYNFSERMHIASYENQQIEIPSPLIKKSSLLVKAILSSSNPNVSPVIDLQQISAYAVSNQINNVTSSMNIAEIDSRKVLGAGDLVAADYSTTGAGTISVTQNTTTVTGVNTTFTTQAVAGNVLKKTDGTVIGTIQTINSNTSITLASNYTGTTLSTVAYNIFSTPSLVFENVSGVGIIRTNIDTADNLLASVGIGKTIVISNCHANVDGTYVVTDVQSVEDKTTYAGNSELDTTKVFLDRTFAGAVTLDMITDLDFNITVYDNFVSDIAPYGCTNAANYVTRTLSLSQAAESFKIIFDANIVNNSSIKIYYRTWTGNVDLRKLPYKDTGFVSTNNDPEGVFVERTVDVNPGAFSNISIKIVMKSGNPVFVPKVKNLRVIALS